MSKVKITITKGKVLKGDKVEIEFKKTNGVENKPASCAEEHSAPPHPDLIAAMAKLRPHAILLSEFIKASSIKSLEDLSEEILNSYNVSGFSIGKDDTGVILTAQKTLSTGKSLGFNTPFVAFDDDSENAYPFSDQLKKDVTSLRSHFADYLGGKFKDDGQLKLYDEKN